MDLVDEEHGPAAGLGPAVAGPVDDPAHLGHAGADRRQFLVDGARLRGHQPGHRRLAGAGRSEEDHRADGAGLDGHPEGRALAEQVALADHFVQSARAACGRPAGAFAREIGAQTGAEEIFCSMPGFYSVGRGFATCSRLAKIGKTAAPGGGSMLSRQVLVLNSTYEPMNVCSTASRRRPAAQRQGRDRRDRGRGLVRSERTFVRRARWSSGCSTTSACPGPTAGASRAGPSSRATASAASTAAAPGTSPSTTSSRAAGEALSSWENVVTSCAPCNVRKGACLPSEVGMSPSRKPRPPLPGDFVLAVAASHARGLAALPGARRLAG